jgi:hypothetical protein
VACHFDVKVEASHSLVWEGLFEPLAAGCWKGRGTTVTLRCVLYTICALHYRQNTFLYIQPAASASVLQLGFSQLLLASDETYCRQL